MADAVSLIADWAASTWEMLVDSALLLLAGIALAGLVHLLLNERSINRLVGGGKRAAVFKAALFGVPLPLCSCSVLPVAYQLRKSGLSRAGTVSFLISTPESGVDSILLTYSLTDPLLTLARPITAFVTAAVAGLTETRFEEKVAAGPGPVGSPQSCTCRAGAVNCGSAAPPPLYRRLWSGLRYAFTDLLGDLAPYLLFGYLLAGLVGAVAGGGLYDLPESLSSGWGGYVGAIIIGLPLYICATSSTPLAAALIVAGFSPGAMLVFMMVGPATNVASLAVVSKILRRWALVRYLLTIVVVALLAGIVTDYLYMALGVDPHLESIRRVESAGWLHILCAAVLSALIIYKSGRRLVRRIL